MSGINFKREISDSFDHAIERATKALAAEGFGILTRIDMHSKIKEKLGRDMIPTVILGACNPALAYEAYAMNPDVASVMPCNAVVREVAPGTVSLEFIAPTAMMRMLDDPRLVDLASDADARVQRALANA